MYVLVPEQCPEVETLFFNIKNHVTLKIIYYMYPKSLLKGFPKSYQKGNHIYICCNIFKNNIPCKFKHFLQLSGVLMISISSFLRIIEHILSRSQRDHVDSPKGIMVKKIQ